MSIREIEYNRVIFYIKKIKAKFKLEKSGKVHKNKLLCLQTYDKINSITKE